MAAVVESGLCIGDLITLKTVKFEAFLGAEGILIEDLIVSEDAADFDDCVFAIHLQRQYSAARELESFLESRKEDEAMDDLEMGDAESKEGDIEDRVDDLESNLADLEA